MEDGVGHHWVDIESVDGDKESCETFRLHGHGIESLIRKLSLVHTLFWERTRNSLGRERWQSSSETTKNVRL
jgi:hypothetical protein